ncbi:MAG: dihydropteroate synthase [Anaerolineae bacterium]|nr:dihydropteroate synthase [Anaerolineae bacterium]
MLIIGENIHIIAPRVKQIIQERDTKGLQQLALEQWEAGARAIDLNIGPQKKHGVEIMEWAVDAVQEVIPDVTISLDTTNVAAIEAGLKRCKNPAFINSTSAEEERLATLPPLAAKYNAKLIALTMTKSGIPVSAEERVRIAMEILIPRITEAGVPIENLYIDPLVLTVAGTQEYVPECVEAVRYLKYAFDPPPKTVVGLSNVSNSVSKENRSLINRTYLVMLMAAGLDAAIADPLDQAQNEVIRIVEERDDSTPVGRLYLALYDAVQAGEELSQDAVDMNDPEQVAIWKTVQVLLNKVIFADSYLRM